MTYIWLWIIAAGFIGILIGMALMAITVSWRIINYELDFEEYCKKCHEKLKKEK